MFLNIFCGTTSIIIMHNLFKTWYPALYQKIIYAGIYNTIYVYSNIQLIYTKYLMYNMKMHHTNCFEFIDNGDPILKMAIDNDFVSIIPILKQNEPLNYDFILYEHNYNTIIYCNIPLNLEYIVSDITFLLFTVSFNDKTYDISLFKKNQFNFYIVNNIIDKQFSIYYFDHFLNIYRDDFTYEATIIDHNVNSIQFSDEDCIIINKTDYTLIKQDAINTVGADEIVKSDSDNDSDKSELSYDLL